MDQNTKTQRMTYPHEMKNKVDNETITNKYELKSSIYKNL